LEIANEPVAKPLVLQLAGGAKLRPTEVGFGATPYKTTNCRNLAEDDERSGVALYDKVLQLPQIATVATNFSKPFRIG
jgi:hypothetical protein